LAARDILRLEAGMPLYGHEISEERDPISAGLGRYVNFTDAKGEKRHFIGADALKKIADGKDKKPTLHAFVLEKGRIPRAGCEVYEFAEDPKKIGVLTSAGPSPTLGKNIALGYLLEPYGVEEFVLIQIGNTKHVATVAKPPFYRRKK
jgi:aminomethyltransferase